MMDTNSALVDDFLTSRASPPVAGSNGTGKRGYAAQQQPMIDSTSIKRIFQLQSHLASLMYQANQCIRELQTYNMFPHITDDERGTQEIASIIVALMQQAEFPLSGGAAFMAPQQQQQQQHQDPTAVYTRKAAAAVPSWECEVKKPANDRAGVDPFSAFDANARMGGGGGGGVPSGNELDTCFGVAATTTTSGGDNYGKNIGAFGNSADASAGSIAGRQGNNNNNNNNNNSSNLPMAFVEFKRSRYRKFLCDDPSIEPGSYVLVDGDRGTDCGLLVQMIHHLPDGQTSVVCMDGCDIKEEKVKLESGRVIREATEAEVDRLHNTIAAAEAVALKTCRQRCQDLGIDIDLIDVEYQFDMKKIAFYFDCDHSVDFRTLVRELYRTFGARIWMENVHPKVKNAVPEAGGNGSDDDCSGNNTHNSNSAGGGGRYYGRGNGGGRGRGGGRGSGGKKH